MDRLRASVVIPTYNRRTTLERVLCALGRQTVSPGTFEVIVVADGCTDGSAALCRELATTLPYALRMIEQANAGPAAARNRAVQEARANLIIFVDDDVVPDEHLIATHLAAHAPNGEDAVVAIGPLLPPRDMRLNAWAAWEERSLCAQYDAMEAGRWQASYRQFYTGNASLARRHIVEAGGFDSRFRRAEDVELGLRLSERGCRFVFLPEAIGWHYVRRNFASWAAMPVAYGEATVAMAREHTLEQVALVAAEYYFRNAAVKLSTRLCLGSATRVALATQALRTVAALGWMAWLPMLTNAACSMIYNLRYYDGFAAELGGARDFWRLIASGQGEPEERKRYAAALAVGEQLLRRDVHMAATEQVEVGARG
jgi:GT2 family glycosyltransferase